MGTDPQQLFGVGWGVRAASRRRSRTMFALEQLHPDGRHWVVLGRFLARQDAERALSRLVAQGRTAQDLRIRRVRKGA
jgi:hypothetical protein